MVTCGVNAWQIVELTNLAQENIKSDTEPSENCVELLGSLTKKNVIFVSVRPSPSAVTVEGGHAAFSRPALPRCQKAISLSSSLLYPWLCFLAQRALLDFLLIPGRV